MVTKKVRKTPPKAIPQKYIFLAEHMADADVDDQQLADKLHTDRVTVTRYRTHQSRINLVKLDRIAKALDRPAMALYAPPGRPSIDAKLHGKPDELVKKANEVVDILLGMAP